MDILEIIKGILAENLDIEPDKVDSSSTFDSLGIDSLDLVELICQLEEECAIDFGEPAGLSTVGELVAYIESL
ncbi:MAG: acyl carrier protein [Eggerthellaceae bacterium]|nr:acyl carrier protein [Eggerthellaceae bacterium]